MAGTDSPVLVLDDRPSRTRRFVRAHAVDLTAVGICLLATAIRAIANYQGFFALDDWQFLIRLQHEGLTWDRMYTQHGGHFMSGGYAILWLLAGLTGSWLPWTAAVATSAGLFLLASLATWWAVRELVGPRWEAVVPLALALTSSITLVASTWVSEWIMLLPVWAMSACALALLVRAWRGSRAAVPLSWLCLAVGLFFMEKALLIPVMMLIVASAWLVRGGPVRSVVAALRRLPGLWVGYLVVSGIYLAVVVPRITDVGARPDPFAALHTYAVAGGVTWPAMLLGGPWAWAGPAGPLPTAAPPAGMTILAAAVAICVVVLSALVRRHALRMWLPLALFAFGCTTAVLTGRVAIFGWTSAMNMHYYADGTALLAATLAVVFLPLRGETDAARPSPTRAALARWHRRHLLLPVVAVALGGVLLGTIVSTQSYLDYWARSPGKAFAQNLEQTLEQYPDAAILDGGTPPAFGIFWPMDPYERTSEQLVIFPRQPRFTDVMTEPWVLTDDGRVLPARMEGTPFERGKDFCGTLVRGSATFAVPGEPYAWQRTLFIDYLAQKAMTITVAFGDDVTRVPVKAGLGKVWFHTYGGGPELTVSTPGADTSVCIGEMTLGNLVPR